MLAIALNEPIAGWIIETNKRVPSVSILLCMMFLDTCMGIVVAYGTRQLSSSASLKGVSKKVGMFIIVMMSGLIDKAAEETSYPTAKMVAIAFSLVEAWSILENGIKLGIKVPAGLEAALSKLRPPEVAPPPPDHTTVNIQRASNVNIPAVQPDGSGSGVNIHQDK